MQDPLSRITALKRPPLPVDAARHGIDGYDRSTMLPRLISATAAGPSRAAMGLLEREAELEARRRSGSGEYRPGRHVELIVALMGEARLLRAAPAG